MRITSNRGFQPVTVVFESQKEIDYIYKILSSVLFIDDELLGCEKEGQEIYNGFSEYASEDPFPNVEINITVSKI